MKIIDQSIDIQTLCTMAQSMFGNIVKAVVDIKLKKMVVDAGLHADEEMLLLQNGSQQENLWGINLYPDVDGDDWIEFDSMINLRPSQGNRTRGVDDVKLQAKIIQIVNELVKR